MKNIKGNKRLSKRSANLYKKASSQVVNNPAEDDREVYRRIGVEPVINCKGTYTIIGASVELPEVRSAMDSAYKYFVQMDELAMGLGQRLAELSGAEWGMVSSGCAAGLKHVTAACVAGGNPEKLVRIPDLTGFEKNEVIIPTSSRSVYDHAVRNIGVKIIMVDTPEQLRDAINPRTAMIYLSSGSKEPLSLETVASIAKPKGVPILVDAAAEVLTLKPNVHLAKGATVVAYSGGKAIKGPQCAGLLLGQKDILLSAWQASAPHHGPGRDNKVGREENMGMLAAVEAWSTRDHDAEMKSWNVWLENIAKKVSTIQSVKTEIRQPGGLSNRTPSLVVTWDPKKLNITGLEMANELATTKPRIAVSYGRTGGGRPATSAAAAAAAEGINPDGSASISMSSWMMQAGDDKVVADRVHQILSQKREPVNRDLKAAGADISGRWDLVIDFFSSKSNQQFSIEKQDGNFLHGSHKGEYTTRELLGTIEGNEVKFLTNASKPGDNVNYTFSGTVSGDTMNGSIHMGEYLTAKFTGKKYTYPTAKNKIVVPVGPPLSS